MEREYQFKIFTNKNPDLLSEQVQNFIQSYSWIKLSIQKTKYIEYNSTWTVTVHGLSKS
jgi:hypothetical protein